MVEILFQVGKGTFALKLVVPVGSVVLGFVQMDRLHLLSLPQDVHHVDIFSILHLLSGYTFRRCRFV